MKPGILAFVSLLTAVFWSQRPPQPIQPPRPDRSIILNVPATAPWTDTGISVGSGDRIVIRGWGSVKFGHGGSSSTATPKGSGLRGGGCSSVVTDSTVPAQSLIGNVAARMTFDGRGFFVGTNWSGSVPIAGSSAPEGQLLLGFNDDAVLCDRTGYDSWAFRINNSGSFTVEISITRLH